MTSENETGRMAGKLRSGDPVSEETRRTRPGGLAPALETYIKAGYPILYVVTPEEDRAIDIICDMLEHSSLKRTPYFWSVSRGLCTMDFKAINQAKTMKPTQILPFLEQFAEPGVFILEDFHFFLSERSETGPVVVRQMRDLVRPFTESPKTLVLLSPVLKIPPELEKDITVVDLDLPGEVELLATLENAIEEAKSTDGVQINLAKGDRERIVQALSGLTTTEAENALYKVVITNRRIDPEDIPLLLSEKEQIIRKSGTLEFYSTPENFNSVGGLNELQHWLRQRGRAFSEEARVFGLPNPRGLLLVGVPGCGKSLSAKAVAAEWQMPLLRFDLGKVFQGLVGESEENMRRALKMAEGVSPCILWIDEIEKGLAGMGGQGDGGVAARVFGTLLTWMEENTKPVFTIATANNVDALPPELLRKGRFDEIFFIDLPTPRERAHILGIHIARRYRDPADFDLAELVGRTDGFAGAELEQVVVSALYEAFAEGEGAQLESRHILRAIEMTRPLSQSMGPQIAQMRQRAQDWRHATSDEPRGEPAAIAAPPPKPAPRPPRRRRIYDA